MKKFIFIAVCCLGLCGCGKKEVITPLLIGNWSYINTSAGETQYSVFKFRENGSFEYSICFYYSTDSNCSTGEAEWDGTYNVSNNRISLTIKNEKQIIQRYNSNIIDPPLNLIVDFDNMYICDGNEGLDCNEKFEKDA